MKILKSFIVIVLAILVSAGMVKAFSGTANTVVEGNLYLNEPILGSGGYVVDAPPAAIGSNLLPTADNTYVVGNSTYRWLSSYATTGYFGASALYSTLTGSTFILGQATGYNLGKFYVDSSGNVNASGTITGTLAAAGSDTQVQYNSSGAFAGDAGFVYNAAADRGTLTYASSTALSAVNIFATTLYGDGSNLTNLPAAASSTNMSIFGNLWVGGSASTTITGNTFSSGVASGFALGKFYIDSAGAAFASSTITAPSANFSTSLIIPTSADPTVDATGKVAIDTTQTSSSVKFYDGTAERALYEVQYKSFTITSSTLMAYSGLTSSSTIDYGVASPHGETWVELSCYTSAGTAEIEVGDGTNWMDYMKLTTSVNTDVSLSNNTFTSREIRKIRVGKASGMDDISCTYGYRQNVD